MTDSHRMPLLPRRMTLLTMLAVALSFGCWEQIDGGEWFPQMKKQPAIAPFDPHLRKL